MHTPAPDQPTETQDTEALFTIALVAATRRHLPGRLCRIAGHLSRALNTEVFVIPWFHIDWDEAGGFISGPCRVYRGGDGNQIEADHRRPHAFLQFPAASPGQPSDGGPEGLAVRRLLERQVIAEGQHRNAIVSRLLRALNERGHLTNQPGRFGRLGAKDTTEWVLRCYERETGQASVRRPESYLTTPAGVSQFVADFHQRGISCLLKPANASRAEGIIILNPGDTCRIEDLSGAIVVQELLVPSVFYDGRKVDFRVYALVHTASREASGRIGPALVRIAVEPFVAGIPAAEICNTSFRGRAGFSPEIYAIGDIAKGLNVDVAKLEADIDGVIAGYLDACFWWIEHDCRPPKAHLSPRALLWGLDLGTHTGPNGEVDVCLLENNVYPQLFRNDARTDALTGEMLCSEYVEAVRLTGVDR